MRLPIVPLAHLDDLWFQVTGTLCNLACTHCFIRCTPHNRSFGFLDLGTIRRSLDESVPLGVKEYYFTGGEPFLHPDMPAILELTLRYGPATVLTNGTLFNDEILRRLRAAEDASPYSLEIRVSIDGYRRTENDAVRGHGTFDRILCGIRQLVEREFMPIITVTKTDDNQGDADLFDGFVRLMRENGYTRPRVKILPTLRIGAEAERRRGYGTEERVSMEMLEGFDQGTLLCNHARIVSDRGVHVCPILIEASDSRLGATLAEAEQPFALTHQACFTCYQYGTICSNPTSQSHDV
ncbi:MAG: radical SAM protein [Planctomycetes bacterium]|nr:radical SAM protein [Planctomycetota bacterium]